MQAKIIGPWSLSPFLLSAGKRHRSFRRVLFLARTAILPPKYRPKDNDHEIDPGDPHPLAPRDFNVPLPLLPLVADLQEPLRVVGNHTVESLLYAPLHHVFFIDRPDIQRSSFRFGIADETCSEEWQHERLCKHVEGDVGDREEFARVWYGEADVGYGEGGEVFGAKREVFDGPAAEDQALIPWFQRVWGYGSNGFCDEAHDVVGVIIELASLLEAARIEVYGVATFISNSNQTFSKPGEAKNSSRSFNLGIAS